MKRLERADALDEPRQAGQGGGRGHPAPGGQERAQRHLARPPVPPAAGADADRVLERRPAVRPGRHQARPWRPIPRSAPDRRRRADGRGRPSDRATPSPRAAGWGWSTPAAIPSPRSATRRRWRPGRWAAQGGGRSGWPGRRRRAPRLPRRPTWPMCRPSGSRKALRRRTGRARTAVLVGRPGRGRAAGGGGWATPRRRRTATAAASTRGGRAAPTLPPTGRGAVSPDGCVTCPWHGSTFRLADGQGGPGPRRRLPAASTETRI